MGVPGTTIGYVNIDAFKEEMQQVEKAIEKLVEQMKENKHEVLAHNLWPIPHLSTREKLYYRFGI